MNDSSPKPKKPLNVRRPAVMLRVNQETARFNSRLVSRMQAGETPLRLENMSIALASDFGFCDGVRRAIEIAYAACISFPQRRIWLIGEIIHNPEVNARLDALGLRHLPWDINAPAYDELQPEDIVIIPAFGVTLAMRSFLSGKGVDLVDTTCGNVVKVWSRVLGYARQGITSIIHGKAKHEESVATASHSCGEDAKGHFLVIFNVEDARLLADYLTGKCDEASLMEHFKDAHSQAFDPKRHLLEIGMANQTTMLKEETEQIQRMLREAVVERDGNDSRFHVFNTICGATQDRQSALYSLLEQKPDAMFIVGGYNSSNTTHLAQIAAEAVPTFFLKSADCLESLETVHCFDALARQEICCPLPPEAFDCSRFWRIGITAGASCPANIIEEVIRRLAELRGCALPQD